MFFCHFIWHMLYDFGVLLFGYCYHSLGMGSTLWITSSWLGNNNNHLLWTSRYKPMHWTVNPLTSVVLLWTSERDTWEFWTLYSDGCPREHNSKILTYNRWCAMPPKKALARRSPYSLPKYLFLLDLSRDVICSVARFKLRVHTLCFESATWNPKPYLTCDLCEADDDVQDEQHAISTAHTPIQCLFAGDMSPYSQRQEHRMFLLFCTRTTTNSYTILHELVEMLESLISRIIMKAESKGGVGRSIIYTDIGSDDRTESDKVRLHRYICLWGHLSGSLEKAWNQTKKISEQIKGKGLGTQPHKRLHHKYLVGSKKSSNALGYPHTEVGRPAGGAVCEC